VPGLIWSTGSDGEPTHVSQGLLDYSGMRFEDFKHVGWKAFAHPDDFPETERAYDHAIQTGTSYEGLMRLRRADGEFRWHHARCEPLRDRQGRIIQWYGLSVDIEERKQAEDRLRRSETYLAEAQRLSHTGSFGWTPSAGELHWSDEIFRILEYDPSIKPTIDRVLQRVYGDDLAMMRRVLDETSRGDIAHRLLMPDGSVKFVHVLSHVLKDTAGNLEIAGALMDVTENTLCTAISQNAKPRFGASWKPTLSASSPGGRKAGFLRPMTHFFRWWDTTARILSRVKCAGPI
jgi:PAS domain S-box-containing protein